MNARWQRAFDEHRRALSDYLHTIESLDDDRWMRPRAPGHWSPALITHHLIAYYEAFEKAAAGELELRFRVGPLWRAALRWFLIPHILVHRKMPLRARAPREVRPSDDVLPRGEAVELLKERFERAEEAFGKVMGVRRFRVSHPYFGRISPLRFLRLSSVHLDHHRRQVESTPLEG